ncbi:uncharacterized protein M421DRAFT_272837 [Didymella exigua CBS 183.55]|uniref:HTH psq-type domain-containing protein n=1 Tax=Didymella exigua CBS 183.55 TaxID=1150837 RepID=A0A6A5RG86_9PLEO|nr:uncharacterized protein M421DRAFT_272837 [Didymella exigua CBS 183.55]KAF1924637.1 hypothetical protein M421DRAFT_272837 [Didymella exigua CBS 183.55]
MPGIPDALAEIDSLKPGDKFVYTKLAEKHSVGRNTLSRAHRGVQAPQRAETQQPTRIRSSQVQRRAISASLTTYKAYSTKFRILYCLTALLQ